MFPNVIGVFIGGVGADDQQIDNLKAIGAALLKTIDYII
jgi:hypothetical protein